MEPVKTLKDYSDNELVSMAQQGNDRATGMLISKYRPFVLRLVRKMSIADAEDVTHDVMMNVLLHLPKFERRSSFTTWLYRVTMNQVFKHKRNKKMLPLEMTNEIKDCIEVHDPPAGEARMKNYFFGMLLCLDDEQRMTLVLSDFFKMDHMAASETLNINPDNFRKRLSRTRNDMKQWMENKCSLVLPGKECRCNRKTRHFVQQGWVDPETMKFSERRVNEVSNYLRDCSVISTTQA